MSKIEMRLDRLLANMGYGSRKDIETLVKTARVTLDGATLAKADIRIAVEPTLSERMRVAGEPLDPPPGIVIALHKPLGLTCSHKDAGPLVYSVLPARWRKRKPAISTIGRLDKETSGLLLLTDDGDFLHRVIAPRSDVTKRYRATLARPLRGNEGAIFASGTLLLDGETKPLLPVTFEILDPNPQAPVVGVTLTEGRYHQVRRMFAALGNHVAALHRDRIGALELPPDLAPGQYRLLDDKGRAAIFA